MENVYFLKFFGNYEDDEGAYELWAYVKYILAEKLFKRRVVKKESSSIDSIEWFIGSNDLGACLFIKIQESFGNTLENKRLKFIEENGESWDDPKSTLFRASIGHIKPITKQPPSGKRMEGGIRLNYL